MPDRLALLLSRQIFAVVTIALIIPVALACGFGLWAAIRIDADALAQERRLAAAGLQEAVDRVAVDQDTSVIWDDAVVEVRNRNQEWLAENLAEWVSEYFQIDRVFILDENDQMLRAVQDGTQAPPSLYAQDEARYQAFVDELRTLMAAASAGLDDSTEAVSGMGVIDFATLADGTTAAISVRPIIPSSVRVQQPPGQEAVHIGVRELRPQLLSQIGDKFAIGGLAFSQDSRGTAASAVVDRAGNVLGHLVWEPDRTAMRLLQTTAPALLGVLAIAAVIVALLLKVLRSTAGRLLASQSQARHLAYHDPLTDLPNRALFEDRVERALVAQRENGTRFALHYVDMDHFKIVNDTMGHPVGDALIKAVANRLEDAVQPLDTVARIGGDEFAIIQLGISNDAEVEQFAAGILQRFADPMDITGEAIKVSLSIGSALCRGPSSADDLMRNADVALYEAKGAGRGRAKLFQGDMDDLVRQRRVLERDLRTALAEGEGLHLEFQPIFAREGQPIGAEALARWTHRERGAIPPQVFVRLAEERGLIEPLGAWVLEEACRVLSRTNLPWLAINISPMQCNDPNLAVRIIATLSANEVAPHRLQIEITEGVLLANSDIVRSNLAQLRQLGVRIALDDFGTGYASISYLRTHGIDKLKIDKSFVQAMVTDQATKSIVEAIVALARAMKMSITLEGVETSEQLEHAKALGADELQGYVLAHPMREERMLYFFRAPPEPHRNRLTPR